MVTTSGVGAALGGSARHRSVFISASVASIASSRAAAVGCWCSQCSEPCRPIVSGQGERATEERRKLSQFVGRLGCHRQRRKLDVGETRWPRHWPTPNVRRGDGLASPCPRHRRSFAELRARRARRVKLRCAVLHGRSRLTYTHLLPRHCSDTGQAPTLSRPVAQGTRIGITDWSCHSSSARWWCGSALPPPVFPGHDPMHELVEQRHGKSGVAVTRAPHHAFADQRAASRAQ